MKKKKQGNSLQLPLWPVEQPQRIEPSPPAEVHQDMQPASLNEERGQGTEDQSLTLDNLVLYSRDMLKLNGPHDLARRDWLTKWAKDRQYKQFWYTTHGKYSGYYRVCIPSGETEWSRYIEKTLPYDMYCCFIQAFAENPLSYCLEDAVARGEMDKYSLHYDDLVWKPSNQTEPRLPKWLDPHRK